MINYAPPPPDPFTPTQRRVLDALLCRRHDIEAAGGRVETASIRQWLAQTLRRPGKVPYSEDGIGRILASIGFEPWRTNSRRGWWIRPEQLDDAVRRVNLTLEQQHGWRLNAYGNLVPMTPAERNRPSTPEAARALHRIIVERCERAGTILNP
ncbi:MAG: hypothetical protein LBR22_01275 [Desulfovibrio sp.]|jgi:hypothetical protein|nr:hypothetical protein [Desulfovibrio sp.]